MRCLTMTLWFSLLRRMLCGLYYELVFSCVQAESGTLVSRIEFLFGSVNSDLWGRYLVGTENLKAYNELCGTREGLIGVFILRKNWYSTRANGAFACASSVLGKGMLTLGKLFGCIKCLTCFRKHGKPVWDTFFSTRAAIHLKSASIFIGLMI